MTKIKLSNVTLDNNCFYSNASYIDEPNVNPVNPVKGDTYYSEWQCNGVDINGNECLVTWRFPEVAGQEKEDLSDYQWDNDVYVYDISLR